MLLTLKLWKVRRGCLGALISSRQPIHEDGGRCADASSCLRCFPLSWAGSPQTQHCPPEDLSAALVDLHTLLPQRPVFLSFAANEAVKLQHGHSLARLLCAGRHSALVEFLLIFTFLWLLITSPYHFCLSVFPFTIVVVNLYLQDQISPGRSGFLLPLLCLLVQPQEPWSDVPCASAPVFQELHNPIETPACPCG